ncbi:hypothetical protein VTJ04DRAFT_678 [Mycothermus thermophilus]|uniref:uncharacterized protein n=1 Tax=Humicola insolens TaxID=85995 RepID=UPI003743D625
MSCERQAEAWEKCGRVSHTKTRETVRFHQWCHIDLFLSSTYLPTLECPIRSATYHSSTRGVGVGVVVV